MLSRPIAHRHLFHHVWQYSKRKGSFGAILLFSTLGLFAQESKFSKKVVMDKLPIPNEKKQLFYLQRDPDENTVVYQLNIVDGAVDKDDPVNAYWIRYAEGGERKGLSLVQRTMAYGIAHEPLDDGNFELRLAAYKRLPLKLIYSEQQKKYVVTAIINGREAILDRIFVRIEGGTVFSPDIAFFELRGRDTATLARVAQKIVP